jgi:hypothetical protein
MVANPKRQAMHEIRIAKLSEIRREIGHFFIDWISAIARYMFTRVELVGNILGRDVIYESLVKV